MALKRAAVADSDSGYIKFTENEIVKTEAIVENVYIDFDEHDRPVGVEVSGNACNVGHKMAQSLQNLKTEGFRDFAINEYLKELRKRSR